MKGKKTPLNTSTQEEVKIVQPAKSALRENIEAICIAIVLALFIRTFIVQAFKIPSGSMKETLQIGDHILVNKFIYGVKIPFLDTILIPVSEPKRKDIIVFRYPNEPEKDFIKRLIGEPGDQIEIKNKKLFINNTPVPDEPYALFSDERIFPKRFSPRDNFGPITVPKDSYFVMGDNRDNSHDGRFWGFVKRKELKGKAFMIYWSWESDRFSGGKEWLTWWEWVRWNRLGNFLK
ncbi:MAG: signal peptidase I [Desulfobacterales bacterium]|nr:signal peptidase I [Desulfobacterales bacterium]